MKISPTYTKYHEISLIKMMQALGITMEQLNAAKVCRQIVRGSLKEVISALDKPGAWCLVESSIHRSRITGWANAFGLKIKTLMHPERPYARIVWRVK